MNVWMFIKGRQTDTIPTNQPTSFSNQRNINSLIKRLKTYVNPTTNIYIYNEIHAHKHKLLNLYRHSYIKTT